jgi:hypothetical protein
MEYFITAEYSSELIKAVSRRFVLRFLGVGYFVAVAILIVFVVYLTLNQVNDWITGALSVVLAFGIIVPSALWWKTERTGLARLKQMDKPIVKFEFSDKGITVDSELGKATVGWKSVEKIWEFPNAWLLFVGKQQYNTIPTSALSDDLKNFIRAQFRAK